MAGFHGALIAGIPGAALACALIFRRYLRPSAKQVRRRAVGLLVVLAATLLAVGGTHFDGAFKTVISSVAVAAGIACLAIAFVFSRDKLGTTPVRRASRRRVPANRRLPEQAGRARGRGLERMRTAYALSHRDDPFGQRLVGVRQPGDDLRRSAVHVDEAAVVGEIFVGPAHAQR